MLLLQDILNTLREPSCIESVLNRLITTCDDITDKQRSEVTIAYVKCRAEKIGIALPNSCKGWSWLWTKCDKAIHDNDPGLWITHEELYQGIEAVCFAYTFEKQQRLIQDEIGRMHATGRNITDGILDLLNEIITLRMEHAAYFRSIDEGIQNTTTNLLSVA